LTKLIAVQQANSNELRARLWLAVARLRSLKRAQSRARFDFAGSQRYRRAMSHSHCARVAIVSIVSLRSRSLNAASLYTECTKNRHNLDGYFS